MATLAEELMAASGGEGGESEEAYCAGLLHDVGEPIVAGFLLEAEDQLSRLGADWLSLEEWLASLRILQRAVGLAVVRQWPVPEPVRQCIESDDYVDGDRVLANTIRLADALARRYGPSVGESGADDLDTLITNGLSLLGLEAGQVERLTTNLTTRVRERLDWQAVPA